jgi:hypothetical protein
MQQVLDILMMHHGQRDQILKKKIINGNNK